MSIRKGNIIIANKTIPSVYTAGDGITINNEIVSAKPDNKSIIIDENAKIAIKPITVDSTTTTFHPDFGETFTTIDTVLENEYGQITKVNTKTVTLPTIEVSDITDLTATANEINQLHSSSIETADLTKLHNVTADANELNILDGATLSTTELNYVEGVTSSIQTQLNDLDTAKVDKTNESLKIYGTDVNGNQVAYDKEEVGQIIQVEILPVANESNVNRICQYIGETDQYYDNGVFYKNVSNTSIENYVNFEQSSVAGTTCTCSFEDFVSFLETIDGIDPSEVIRGHFGFYSGTPDSSDASYSITLYNSETFVKYFTKTVTELEAAGFTFNPYLSAQDGLDFTCAVNREVTEYSWTPIYVQKKNIIFVDWGA